jgi:riboflavin kinase/FMN adenylyltransferase
MERVFGGAVPAAMRGGVVALGNFDGFHLGHQAVVGAALDAARVAGRPALVATFDPHPARVFRPDSAPFALTTTDQKLDLLAVFGVSATMIFPFDAAFAALSGPEFVRHWLADAIGATAVVSGADFTFGAKRSCDTTLLAEFGAACGIAASVVPAVTDASGILSSSRIRALLQGGDTLGAAELLTRPFTLRGTVEHGAKLGRTLGFPTANLTLGDYLRPAYGVYAVRALVDGRWADGVANLGIRPMIEPPLELLEVHLFDWVGDLYGRVIDVALVAYLRPEWKLDGLVELTAQIARDVEAARAELAVAPQPPRG